jgi:hypothetical protein
LTALSSFALLHAMAWPRSALEAVYLVGVNIAAPHPGPFYQDYYKDDKHGRIALLNCLAAYKTSIAARSKVKQVLETLSP